MSTDYGLIGSICSPTDEKTEDEITRVTFHFAERLDGETIATTEFELPDGLTNVDEDDTDSVQSVLVSGGTRGRSYRVTCTVTTSGGQTLQQTKRVWVRE